MASMRKRIAEIRRKIEEKSEETAPYDEIWRKEVILIIEDTAGMDPRTVNKYLDKMIERGILKLPMEQERALEDADMSLEIPRKADRFKIEKQDRTGQTPQVNGEKKTISATVSKQLLEQADAMNLNKSAVMEKALAEQVSNLEDMIKIKADREMDGDAAEFIYDLIIHDAYLANKNDNLRKELYTDKFGPYNEYDCEELRKKAADLAEDLGLIQKPEGL